MRALSYGIIGVLLGGASFMLAGKEKAVPRVAGDAAAGELREMEAAFERALAARDLDAFMGFWAEDAAYLAMHQPIVTGREAIRAAWAPLVEDRSVSLSWTPERAEAAASGDLGYTYGKYRLAVTAADGSRSEREGKYTTIWRRGGDGRWRVVLDTGNPSSPPAR